MTSPPIRSHLVALALTGLALGPVASASAACGPSPLAADPPVPLRLPGAGAKGAYEAGAAAGLVERGVPIRLVAGSSAGALNAAMIADGRLDRLEALWRGLTRDRVYALRARVFFAGLLPGWLTLLTLDHAGSLFDPEPLRELIGASLDLERIRASPVQLLVVTTDLQRREPRVFDNRTVTREVLMAASAVPGAVGGGGGDVRGGGVADREGRGGVLARAGGAAGHPGGAARRDALAEGVAPPPLRPPLRQGEVGEAGPGHVGVALEDDELLGVRLEPGPRRVERPPRARLRLERAGGEGDVRQVLTGRGPGAAAVHVGGTARIRG